MPGWCKPDAYPGPDLSPGLPGGCCTDPSANRTASIPKCSPSGFLCAPSLDKRWFIKLDHLAVTIFPRSPLLCYLTSCSRVLGSSPVPIPALQQGWEGPHQPHRALGPPLCKEPSPVTVWHPGRQQGPHGLGLAGGGTGNAGTAAGPGLLLHILCSSSDPCLGKSRLNHLGAGSWCTESSVCP